MKKRKLTLFILCVRTSRFTFRITIFRSGVYIELTVSYIGIIFCRSVSLIKKLIKKFIKNSLTEYDEIHRKRGATFIQSLLTHPYLNR